ncbi:MAG: NusA-like transcription termination signal-binding factor [Candidatus Aenigmatarchaeota archaeon]
MNIVFDTESIKKIAFFQKMTGAHVVDFIENDEIYIVIKEGESGLAIGRGGEKVRKAESAFKKSLRILEYSTDMEQFLRNVIPDIISIQKDEEGVIIRVRPSVKAKVVGREGCKAKIIGQFLKRLFDIENFKIK